MNKEYILKYIEDLSAHQLFDLINQDVVSLDELRETGNLDASKRRAIVALQKETGKEDNEAWKQARSGNEDLLCDYIKRFPRGNHVQDAKERLEDIQRARKESDDNEAWKNSRYGNESSLRDYISCFPNGKYVDEAKQRIDNLEAERNKALAQRDKVKEEIRKNPNSYSPYDIIEFLENGTLTELDLLDVDIPQSAIDNLYKVTAPRLNLGDVPEYIPSGFTEVYLWGGPGSGKTTALGAILQVADKNGYLEIVPGAGFHYANQLKNIFSDDGVANDYLPAPTPAEVTQYLPFTLKKSNEKHSRSVSTIELSGEVFQCFYYVNANLPFPTQSHQDSFYLLNDFLKSNNRKIHFFFLDYDRGNKPDHMGIRPSDYLSAASTYFQKTNLFDKTTDAVYVVLTKSDLMLDDEGNHVSVEERVKYAKEYLGGNNYKSFIETLKSNIKNNGINGGKLTVEPFTLGKVYFQDICDFEGSSAENIVNILMDRIKVSKKSILDIFNK